MMMFAVGVMMTATASATYAMKKWISIPYTSVSNAEAQTHPFAITTTFVKSA
jgi:hypothetical protein